MNLDFSPDIKDVLYQHIVDNSERWLQLRCKRVLDSVDIELFRNDGSRAGSISKNDLSDGQRNTAVLALLSPSQILCNYYFLTGYKQLHKV